MQKHGMAGWLGAVVLSFAMGCGLPAEDLLDLDEDVVEYQEELTAAGVGLVARVSGPASFAAGEDVAVDLELRNEGTQRVWVIKRDLPTPAARHQLFAVSLAGSEVPFRGPHFKFRASRAEDFVALAPGERLLQKAKLTGAYDFTATGSYEVRYQSVSFEVVVGGVRKLGTLTSAPATFWIEGRASVGIAEQGLGTPTPEPTPGFKNCTSSEVLTLESAKTAGTSMSVRAARYLRETVPGPTPRYKTWFGAFTSSRWQTAFDHFVAIRSAFRNQPVVINCNCNDDYYAYVYPTSPYQIWVCNSFWSAPMTGTDSKGGTLVHEMSHFQVVADTEDWAYSQSGCKSLAASSPSKALDNADCHEYFAENTPFLQ